MANSNPNPATRFAPGNGYGGRQAGARARLSAKFQQALADDFDEHGDGVIQLVRANDPSTYLSLVAKLQPREVEAKLQVEQKIPGNLTADEYAQLRGVLELLERLAPAVATGEVLATVEAALIAAYVEPAAPLAIEHKPALPMEPVLEPVAIAPPPPY